MIKFFRKIRQQLLIERKTGKYFRYAIGEILLVMVGILLALQVNNWNEERKQEIELKGFLNKIAQNIREDIAMAKLHKSRRENTQKNSKLTIEMLMRGEFNLELVRKSDHFFYEFYFRPNLSGYEALKSSGYISKIRSSNLDSILHKYYALIDYIEDREISYNEFIENIELQFKTKHSLFDYMKFMRFENADELQKNTERMKKFKTFILSNEFQAGLVRSSRTGTQSYDDLIAYGNAFIVEAKTYYGIE